MSIFLLAATFVAVYWPSHVRPDGGRGWMEGAGIDPQHPMSLRVGFSRCALLRLPDCTVSRLIHLQYDSSSTASGLFWPINQAAAVQ